jgi:hypothetical protein
MSINTPSFLEKEIEDEGQKYARRLVRNYSMENQNYQRNLYKVIIPYDFERNRYFIKGSDISFYSHKDYVLKTLYRFCENPLFNIESKFQMQGKNKLLINFLFYFLLSLIIYGLLLTSFVVVLNPGVLVIVYFLIQIVRKRFRLVEFLLNEKMKVQTIKKILEQENESGFCQEEKIKWVLGESGYWIEIVKLV